MRHEQWQEGRQLRLRHAAAHALRPQVARGGARGGVAVGDAQRDGGQDCGQRREEHAWIALQKARQAQQRRSARALGVVACLAKELLQFDFRVFFSLSIQTSTL